MESAILGVILDSSVMMDAERRRLDVARFLKNITAKIGDREAALSSITVAELAHGILSRQHTGTPPGSPRFPR